MLYSVKEIFLTIQGEGAKTGHAAVFVRFQFCNLWSGREDDRPLAVCKFCDTDFVGGERLSAQKILDRVMDLWQSTSVPPYVVLTGGEPGLQVNQELIELLHTKKCFVQIETNGTVELPYNINWVTVSPKAETKVVVNIAEEIKLVYPQEGIDPEYFVLGPYRYRNHFLQPMDGPQREASTQACVEYVKRHPEWRLSIQTHKVIGIP